MAVADHQLAGEPSCHERIVALPARCGTDGRRGASDRREIGPRRSARARARPVGLRIRCPSRGRGRRLGHVVASDRRLERSLAGLAGRAQLCTCGAASCYLVADAPAGWAPRACDRGQRHADLGFADRPDATALWGRRRAESRRDGALGARHGLDSADDHGHQFARGHTVGRLSVKPATDCHDSGSGAWGSHHRRLHRCSMLPRQATLPSSSGVAALQRCHHGVIEPSPHPALRLRLGLSRAGIRSPRA